MKNIIAASLVVVATATSSFAQETINNPAIDAENIERLQTRITNLEEQLASAGEFIGSRKPELVELSDKIKNADADTQRVIDDLNALVDEFKSGSDIQLAVEGSMQDVREYIDRFRAGTAAEQTAAASLTDTLESMKASDERRNDLVGKALTEIRRLEAMKGDMVALRIAGAFSEMSKLYDSMINEFEATVNETTAVADSLENMTQLPVQ